MRTAVDQGLNHGDHRPQQGNSALFQPFQRKPKRLKKDGTPYKPRKGWGPYRSVPNERAAAFNLQLDVQALQQETRNLTTLSDVLRTKPLIQRHKPELVVKEFFRVFRVGPVSKQQRDFLYNMVDAEVDVGSGRRGPGVILHQLDMYSTMLRWIQLKLHSIDTIEAEDSVIVKANTALRFRIIPETIAMFFPHIVGFKWLEWQLVGKEVEARIGMTFYFNAEGMCSKLDMEADFVGAFAGILQELSTVEMLLGGAVVTESWMLGPAGYQPSLNYKDMLLTNGSVSWYDSSEVQDTCEPTYVSCGRSGRLDRALFAPGSSYQSVTDPAHKGTETSCLRAVQDYYLAFASGFLSGDNVELAPVFQRDFLLHRFAPERQACAERTAERWRSLSQCFSVLRFRQEGVASVELHHIAGMYLISSSAIYALCITPTTIRTVFPHILAHAHLCEDFTGEVLAVPSQIDFAIEMATGRICCIEERMEFEAAMAKIVANARELELVMSGANLSSGGVDSRSRAVFLSADSPRTRLQ